MENMEVWQKAATAQRKTYEVTNFARGSQTWTDSLARLATQEKLETRHICGTHGDEKKYRKNL
jgi:hypothetical protein